MVLAPHHVWAVRALLTIMVGGGLAGPKSEMPWDWTHFGVDGRVSERLKDRSTAWPQLLPARPPRPTSSLRPIPFRLERRCSGKWFAKHGVTVKKKNTHFHNNSLGSWWPGVPSQVITVTG